MLVKTHLEDKPKTLVTANPTTTIDDAMDLLISNKIGCLPVVDDNDQLLGIISDKDIFQKIYEKKTEYMSLKVADMMTTDLIVGLPEDELNYIAGVMDKNWIRHVPIVKEDQLVGLISLGDIIRTQTEHAQIENRYLKLYTDGLGLRDKSADS